MIRTRALQSVGPLRLPRRLAVSPVARYAHTAPTGTPTFVKGASDEDSVAPLLVAFGAAFAATVLGLYYHSRKQPGNDGLQPDHYSPFTVLEATKASLPGRIDGMDGEHVRLKVDAPLARSVAIAQRVIGQRTIRDNFRILSVFMKEPSLQIERPYTPLYADALDGSHADTPLELLIKRYPDGELGKYAHRLSPGAQVELRGPEVTWQGPKVDHFVLIVGGTGITPAYQLLNTVYSQANTLAAASSTAPKLPKITLLYAARSPSSLLLLPELAALKTQFPKHIDLRLHVDQLEEQSTSSRSIIDFLRGRPHQIEGQDLHLGQIDVKAVKAALDGSKGEADSRRILVCGPDGLVAQVSGPKQGKLQGRLGGFLAALDCPEDQVWKL